jgi:transcriptional/translational regulatory protein YebC/TACO1
MKMTKVKKEINEIKKIAKGRLIIKCDKKEFMKVALHLINENFSIKDAVSRLLPKKYNDKKEKRLFRITYCVMHFCQDFAKYIEVFCADWENISFRSSGDSKKMSAIIK